MFQFYPNYELRVKPYFDPLFAIINEIDICDSQFQMEYRYGIPTDLVRAMLFCEIATDFLIRYHNYSLIKCSKCKINITSQNNCHKKFEEYLYNGYSLLRRRKVILKNKTNLELNERFLKLPIFPTREIGYPIDEIIEMEDGSYQKVL